MIKIKVWALCLIGLAILTGCHHQPTYGVGGEAKTLTVDKAVSLRSKGAKAVCRVHISMELLEEGSNSAVVNHAILNSDVLPWPYRPSSARNEQPQKVLNTFAHRWTKGQAKEWMPYLRTDGGRTTSYDRTLNITGQLVDGPGELFNYVAQRVEIAGTDTVDASTVTLHFDKRTGRLLHFSDVFRPGADVALTGLLQGKASYLSSQFIVKDDGCTFIYQPGEIAPRSNGTVNIHLPYDDIINSLKQTYGNH